MKFQSRTICALLLDFDGVVVESAHLKTEAFIEMFKEYPEHLDTIVDYHQQNMGMSRFKKFAWAYEKVLNKPLPPKGPEELGRRFSEIVLNKVLRAPFVQGALETLKACRLAGLPTFVISGTPHEELTHIMAFRNLDQYFTDIWGSPTEKTEAIQQIQTAYGWNFEEMVFVGDGLCDYNAAKSTGVSFIARPSQGSSIDWREKQVAIIQDLSPLARRIRNVR